MGKLEIGVVWNGPGTLQIINANTGEEFDLKSILSPIEVTGVLPVSHSGQLPYVTLRLRLKSFNGSTAQKDLMGVAEIPAINNIPTKG